LLRASRKQIADDKGVPTYVLFHDSVLMQMVDERPQLPEHFLQMSGVGQKKCDQYAAIFIQVIKDYLDQKKQTGELSDTITETWDLFKQGHDVANIVSIRSLSESTIYSHAAQLIRQQCLSVDQVLDMPESDIGNIESAFVDLGLMEDNAKLKPAYEALAEVYSYSILRCIHAYFLSKL